MEYDSDLTAEHGCIACALERVALLEFSPDQHTHNQARSSTETKDTAGSYTLDEYQQDASTTAIYPGIGTSNSFAYLILKLNGESGELAEAYGKFLRGDYDFQEFCRIADKEVGDVLWYASQISRELGQPFSNIARNNIRKLHGRKERGTIHGSGNDR